MANANIYEYPLPNSLTLARRLGVVWYFTGRPCKRGHADKRYVKNGTCYSCMKEAHKARSQSDEFKAGARRRNRRYIKRLKSKDPEGFRAKVAQKSRQWLLRNRELVRERRKTPENRAKILEKVVRRQRRTKQATPAWADRDKIRRTYLQAALASASSGVPHHVDHYIPVAGKSVCGLHCHNNLQVIPYWKNIEKGNKWYG